MIDSAGIEMAQGYKFACERLDGMNDNMTNSHYHDFYELYYLESGERYHLYEDELHYIHSGELILFPPYIMHRSYGLKDVYFKRIVLYFRADQIQSNILQDVAMQNGGVYTFDSTTRRIVSILLQGLATEIHTNPYSEDYFKSVINLLLITIFRNAKPHEKPVQQTRIEQIINYIHNHYNDELTLELLSKEFYISSYHLCHEFKKYTGRSVIQYINITRIMNAQRKIMETDDSITTIANECGFPTITHFNRIFKKITGISPLKYRNSAKEIESLQTKK